MSSLEQIVFFVGVCGDDGGDGGILNMQSLQEHLLSLEQKLIHPQIRKSLDELNALLADDFIEFGSSGGVVNKLTAIEGMLAESPLSAIISDFEIRDLAPNVVLATYRSCRLSDMRYALRSSIWNQNGGKWQICFHQGTITRPPEV